jgi:hypothetical protein
MHGTVCRTALPAVRSSGSHAEELDDEPGGRQHSGRDSAWQGISSTAFGGQLASANPSVSLLSLDSGELVRLLLL